MSYTTWDALGVEVEQISNGLTRDELLAHARGQVYGMGRWGAFTATEVTVIAAALGLLIKDHLYELSPEVAGTISDLAYELKGLVSEWQSTS